MAFTIVKAIMSSFFPCHPKILCLHTWPIIWFDHLSNLLHSIKNGCESDCRFRRWNGRLRKETIIHQTMTQFHINLSKYVLINKSLTSHMESICILRTLNPIQALSMLMTMFVSSAHVIEHIPRLAMKASTVSAF